jgi:hypothetical protein
MRCEYDVFEKFSDGSTLWRATVRGRFEAQRKMDELSEHSENKFYMLDIQEQFLLSPLSSPDRVESSATAATAS